MCSFSKEEGLTKEMDAFGGSRLQVKPPERGVFALDHDHECRKEMKLFLSCLKENNSDHYPCRDFSATYLKCRMEKDLMAKDDMDNIGMGEKANYVRQKSEESSQNRGAFTAGTGVKASKKWSFW